MHIGVSAMFLPRGLLESQEKEKKPMGTFFTQEPPQSMCILTHWFDDTAFQKRRGSVRNIVRGEFAFLGVSLVSPCEQGVHAGIGSQASGRLSWLCWAQPGRYSRHPGPFPAK